jgi:hypothetical protein
MKKLIILLALLTTACWAEPTVTVTWDWGDTNTTGYVYVGSASRNYTTNWMVATNVAQITVPVSQTRYVTVTAVNPYGDQSDYANELAIQRIKPNPPVITKYTVSTK